MEQARRDLQDIYVKIQDLESDARAREHGSWENAEAMLRQQGANRVLIAATHPVLTGDAMDRLKKADVEQVIVTDTIPIPADKLGSPLTVLSVAPLLAEAIIRVHENRSVSELFR